MAKRQVTDEEDRLKRQARRRLIGAVALTTAIVVVLPMIMDSAPRPVGQNIELRIPDKDAAGEFSPKIDLPPVSSQVAEVPASEPVTVASEPVAVPPPPVPAPAAPVAPVAPVAAIPAPVPVAAPKPVPTNEPKPATPVVQSAAKPEQKVNAGKSDAKPAQPKREAKPAPAKHDAKSGALTEQGQPAPQSGFIVQIGAFNNADTAHSWQKNLKTQGFKAYTEKLGGKTRVRIGPYSTHAAASAARQKLEKTQGLHSNIINLN